MAKQATQGCWKPWRLAVTVLIVMLFYIGSIPSAASFCPRPQSKSPSLSVLFALSSADDNDERVSHPASILQPDNSIIPRRRQMRSKSQNRRPANYWLKIETVELELRQLWATAGISLNAEEPPPIPNETLLNYWKRHDLRSAIVRYGGRELLSELLGGARIIPGKWVEAVQTCPGIQELLDKDPALSADIPPLSPQQMRTTGVFCEASAAAAAATNNDSLSVAEDERKATRWSHQSGRKDPGYWDLQLVIQEL
jgi:hypothetical protein